MTFDGEDLATPCDYYFPPLLSLQCTFGVTVIPLLPLQAQVLQLRFLLFFCLNLSGKARRSLSLAASDRMAGGVSKVPNDGEICLSFNRIQDVVKEKQRSSRYSSRKPFDKSPLR